MGTWQNGLGFNQDMAKSVVLMGTWQKCEGLNRNYEKVLIRTWIGL